MSEEQFAELTSALLLAEETAAVMVAVMVPSAPMARGPVVADSLVAGASDVTLLCQNLIWVPEAAYLSRTGFGLSIASGGWVPTFRSAASESRVPIFVHTHPAGEAFFSDLDDQVDAELASAARGFGAPGYASIVVAGRSEAPVVIARLQLFDTSGSGNAEGGDGVGLRKVEAVRVAGANARLLLPPTDTNDEGRQKRPDQIAPAIAPATGVDVEDVFDRQIRMLGAEGQRTLSTLRVAVVGTGGTGSAVAVQLARLGIGSLQLIDDDIVTAATPTRGHGMRVADVGRSKVSVLAEHLRGLGLGTHVTEIHASLHDPQALLAIQHVDAVFSCVDGHGARLILNRFAYAHLTVVIDLAVLVTLSGTGTEIDERVTWIAPGTACLLCRGRLDATRAYAENLSPEDRKRLAGEGYVQAIDDPQPAVVTLTTLVASLACTEFLLRTFGIGSTQATELLLRPHVGELRRNRVPQRSGCFCTDPHFLARGQRLPYLDLMWASPPLGDQTQLSG